jgi:glyoxylase-like metal-dependent hydrolase (beta-lactamase superfamily II)
MPAWLKWVGIGFAALIAVLGVAYWWYFLESSVPDGKFALDLAKLRSLANSVQAEKPVAVRVEHVGSGVFPLAIAVAGGSWTSNDVPFQSFQIVYPGGRSVIIDTGMDKATATKDGAPKFYDEEAYARVVAAMERAERIVVTHEHFDHMAGLTNAPNVKALMNAAVLTAEQVASTAPAGIVAKVPPDALQGYKPLSYERHHVLSPGVVLIKAPGHTPGSQMIFVQLQNGVEYLFLGDVAWTMANVDLVRERPRAVTQFFLQEDRNLVALQLRAIKEAKDANPDLKIVPGHDQGVLNQALAEGWLTAGFLTDAGGQP